MCVAYRMHFLYWAVRNGYLLSCFNGANDMYITAFCFGLSVSMRIGKTIVIHETDLRIYVNNFRASTATFSVVHFNIGK